MSPGISAPTSWTPVAAEYFREREAWRVLCARYHPDAGLEFAERVVDPETLLLSERGETA